MSASSRLAPNAAVAVCALCALSAMPGPAVAQPAPGARGAPVSAAAPPGPDSGPVVARRALAVIERHCAGCHGGARFGSRANRGGFDFALSPERVVAAGLVVRYQPDESELLQRVRDGEMPPPEVTARPGEGDVEALRVWIAAGAPTPGPADAAAAGAPPAPARARPLGVDAVYAAIRADLARAPADARRHLRYASVAHLVDAGRPEPEIELVRQAVAKLVNSLSWTSRVYRPVAIDRDRAVLRIDLRQLGWQPEVWERVAVADPYAFVRRTADAQEASRLAGTPVPFVRADWLVSGASRPPLYHDILDLPRSAAELDRRLGIDADFDVRRGFAVRAGFNRSGVSQNNRVIQRHPVGRSGGYLWRSYDFANNTGTRNIFDHPLGPATADSREPDSFTPDGGEIIFSLPNGFQAYLLVDARGRRIDKAPTGIVTDPGRPDSAVENGLSCMGCHSLGVLDKADEIRAHVVSNRAAFDRRNRATASRVLALYPPRERVDALLARDRARFERALAAAGVSAEIEPIAFAARAFEAELDADLAAAELSLPRAELARRLARDELLGRKLGALLVEGGTVKRDAFVAVFATAIERLGVGAPIAASTPEQRLIAVCSEGTGEDCARAAEQLLTGRGVRPDVAQAARLYELSCARNHAAGCVAIGRMLAAGQGVRRDAGLAAARFSRACDLGDAVGCEELARALSRGDGVKKDRARAAALFDRACRAGSQSACHEVAEAIFQGRGVDRDRRRGLRLFEQACNAGSAASCRRAADILEDGKDDIDEDEAKAAFLYRKACLAGDTDSCVEAGERYYDGDGVPKQRGLRAQLYQKACDAGSAEGCHRLAHQVRSGEGVRKDKQRAKALMRRACELGKQRACAGL